VRGCHLGPSTLKMYFWVHKVMRGCHLGPSTLKMNVWVHKLSKSFTAGPYPSTQAAKDDMAPQVHSPLFILLRHFIEHLVGSMSM
jgi:hypothetical protein